MGKSWSNVETPDQQQARERARLLYRQQIMEQQRLQAQAMAAQRQQDLSQLNHSLAASQQREQQARQFEQQRQMEKERWAREQQAINLRQQLQNQAYPQRKAIDVQSALQQQQAMKDYEMGLLPGQEAIKSAAAVERQKAETPEVLRRYQEENAMRQGNYNPESDPWDKALRESIARRTDLVKGMNIPHSQVAQQFYTALLGSNSPYATKLKGLIADLSNGGYDSPEFHTNLQQAAALKYWDKEPLLDLYKLQAAKQAQAPQPGQPDIPYEKWGPSTLPQQPVATLPQQKPGIMGKLKSLYDSVTTPITDPYNLEQLKGLSAIQDQSFNDTRDLRQGTQQLQQQNQRLDNEQKLITPPEPDLNAWNESRNRGEGITTPSSTYAMAKELGRDNARSAQAEAISPLNDYGLSSDILPSGQGLMAAFNQTPQDGPNIDSLGTVAQQLVLRKQMEDLARRNQLDSYGLEAWV